MSIIRVVKQPNKFAVIDTFFYEDNRLSAKAKGILGYLLTKPDSWEIRMTDLLKKFKDRDSSLRSGLKELRKFGYAKLRKNQNEQGKMIGSSYDVYERPSDSENRDSENRNVGKETPSHRDSDFPKLGKTETRKITIYSNIEDNNSNIVSNTLDINNIESISSIKEDDHQKDFFSNEEEEKDNTSKPINPFPSREERELAEEEPTSTPIKEPDILFKDSKYIDKEILRKELDNDLYEVCKLADESWYISNCLKWSNNKQIKMTEQRWYSTIVKFISTDYTKGELRKKEDKKSQKEEYNPRRPIR